MEFDRGSRMAQRRRPGQRPRAASIVAFTAVGWCAKSSTTNTPPISPRTSIRRLTLRNVGMIVFERRDNQIIGMVVEKLWPAVPESSFILVAFQNKLFAAAKSVTLAEVLRDAAHEKIGLLSRRVKNPSEHRRRGGLSVRTADDDGMFLRKKDFFENFWHRAIGNLAVKHFFQLRIYSRNDI